MKAGLVVRALALGAALAAGDALAREPSRSDVYSKDVEFLLDNLEKKAGAFLRMKKVDWDAVAKEFRADVKKVKDDVEFVKLANRLVARLRDGHACLKDVKVAMPDETNGRKYGAPGVFLVPVGDRVYVKNAWGPAAAEHVAAGDEVVKVDGRPVKDWLAATVARLSDERGYSTDHQALYAACSWGLADFEGTKIAFDLVHDGKPLSAVVARAADTSFVPEGPAFPPQGLQQIGRQSYGRTPAGFGYVHLRDVPQDLPAQIDPMIAALADAPGLILDARANGGGGTDEVAVWWRFNVDEKAAKDPKAKPAVAKPYLGPMVVIVDAGVRSAGETVAGMFKEWGRAYMIGDAPTAGMSSKKETLPVPSGLFSVYYSWQSNERGWNGNHGIEGIGVPPHEIVPYAPADLAKGADTLIARAEKLLKDGFPKGKVSYKPPEKR